MERSRRGPPCAPVLLAMGVGVPSAGGGITPNAMSFCREFLEKAPDAELDQAEGSTHAEQSSDCQMLLIENWE